MNRNLVASGLLLICLYLFVSPSATLAVDPDCSNCQPFWITLLKNYLQVTNLKKNGPLCKYGIKNLFTACQPKPNQQVCPSKEGVIFHCCDKRCLPMLQHCFEGTTIKNNVCIPSNLSRWQETIAQIHFTDKASRKTSGSV